jgi:hypothetical protein
MPENGSLWSPQNLVRRAHESSATAMAMPELHAARFRIGRVAPERLSSVLLEPPGTEASLRAPRATLPWR